MKYEGPKFYQSKDMANVKVCADKQTDAQTNSPTDRPKTICPQSVDAQIQAYETDMLHLFQMIENCLQRVNPLPHNPDLTPL